jgi:hypothetical protein
VSQELYKIKLVLMPNCNANKVGTKRLNDVVIRVFVTSSASFASFFVLCDCTSNS